MEKRKSLWRHLSNTLFILVIVTFVVVTVITMLSAFNMRQDRLLFGTFGFGRVVTGSMEPDIPTGSFVLVREKNPSLLKEGTVIMFRSEDPDVPPNTPVCHQIVRIETDENGIDRYITKGTANPIEDTYPVYEDHIIGVVEYSSLLLGKIVGVAQSAYVYPVLILLLAISLIQSVVDVIKQIIILSKEKQI